MKKLILICLLILIPMCIFSQELGINYSFNKFKDFPEDQLKSRLFWNNTATVGSVLLSVGGVAAIVGDFLMEPLSAVYTYLLAGASASGFGLALLGYGALKMSINAIGQLNGNRQLIKVELTQFQPSSYKDSPGIGIGISIAIG